MRPKPAHNITKGAALYRSIVIIMDLKINRYNTTNKKRRMITDAIYIGIMLAVFIAFAAFVLVLPRSTESELEQRDLAKMPAFSIGAFLDGSFTADLDNYFVDTVPFRDQLMVVSSAISEFTGFRVNNIKLHNVTLADAGNETPVTEATEYDPEMGNVTVVDELPVQDIPPAESFTAITPTETEFVNPDDSVNMTNNGIAVVGTRALMLYGGNYTVGDQYAEVINKYKTELGSGVNVYSMVIPTSVEFYCPDSVKPYTGSQLDNINNIYSKLSNVTGVDVYTALSQHTSEPIYLRTDHHWASLGAYYAAEQFAAAAGVPFADLSEYDEYVVDGYVGTMYSYSQDITIKNNPEDFVYYVPKNVELDTTYYNYTLGENNEILGMQAPLNASFYVNFTTNKSMLYCTFMGGDAKITHVHTSTSNGRKLAIFKDSYGNALPQFLFGSFEDIYVLDMRYFTYNAIDYLKEKGITDLLFANNAFHATTKSTVTYYNNFLIQGRASAVTTAPAVTSVPSNTTTSGATTTGVTTTVATTTTQSQTSSAPAAATSGTTAGTTVTTQTAQTTAPPQTTTKSQTTTTRGQTTTTKAQTTTTKPQTTATKPQTTTASASQTNNAAMVTDVLGE